MATVILGFDPGSKRSAYGLIEVAGTRAQPRFSFLATGDIESSGPAADEFFARCAPLQASAGQIVAVEVVQGKIYGDKGAGIAADLFECKGADAMLCENVRWRGIHLVRLPAVRWRKAVANNAHATDPEIKAAVARLLRGLPERTNNHGRDALGIAIAVGMGMHS